MLTSMSNVQESLLGSGQQVYIGAPERIESLAHEIATLGVIGRAQRPVTPPRPPR
jgi:hypothetical protein